MTYDLYIGDRSFSSWSLRGWLMLEAFGLPHRIHLVGLYAGTLRVDLAGLAPARTVPVLRCPDGAILTDSLAMAETLVDRHPDAGLYPADPIARALARSMVAEMHSDFGALRSECPMNLRHGWRGVQVSDAVTGDLERITELFTPSRERFGADGPWLFGRYSLADAFYAPVALRIAGYGLPVGPLVQDYVQAQLADPRILHWRSEGERVNYDSIPYPMPANRIPWPGP
jgi:glutathione S-transferase